MTLKYDRPLSEKHIEILVTMYRYRDQIGTQGWLAKDVIDRGVNGANNVIGATMKTLVRREYLYVDQKEVKKISTRFKLTKKGIEEAKSIVEKIDTITSQNLSIIIDSTIQG